VKNELYLMKKILLILLTGLTFLSCQKEVEDNSPAFQTKINNDFWKTSYMSAHKDALGGLTLTANFSVGDIVLTTTSANAGTYVLGTTNQLNKATYTLVANSNKRFTTGISQNPVNVVRISAAGTGYVSTDLVPTTGGTGTGLKVNTTVNATGGITGIEVNVAGNGYKAGDLITVTGGNNNAILVVQNVANSNGEVKITKNEGNTISGNFKFTAFDAISGETVMCREGFFYKVPIN
jgi:hypothetical protein